MSKSLSKRSHFLESIYSFLLFAYPTEFRREYGEQMAQLLRDCQREAAGALDLVDIWLRTLMDLVRTIPAEHVDRLRKERSYMSKVQNLIALFACALIIIVAVLLLNYGRSHEVPSILVFGYALDAVIVTGIVGNVIVFLLKLTNLNDLRVAFWTFLIVNALPAVILTIIGHRLDPQFSVANTILGYLVSFVFWYGLHWFWIQKNRSTVKAAT